MEQARNLIMTTEIEVTISVLTVFSLALYLSLSPSVCTGFCICHAVRCFLAWMWVQIEN